MAQTGTPASSTRPHPRNDPRNHPRNAPRPRWRIGLAPLVALNAALLGGLAFVEFGPRADAQQGMAQPPARPRGEYTLVGGEILTGNSNAVYIIDSVNQEMIVLRWEDGRNIIDGIGYRDLDADGKARAKR